MSTKKLEGYAKHKNQPQRIVFDERTRVWGSRQIPTNDDWLGTFDNGTVRGTVAVLSTWEIRVMFWGTDDFGLELDLPYTADAFARWNDWLTGLSYIDQRTLFDLGFIPA